MMTNMNSISIQSTESAGHFSTDPTHPNNNNSTNKSESETHHPETTTTTTESSSDFERPYAFETQYRTTIRYNNNIVRKLRERELVSRNCGNVNKLNRYK